MERYLVNIFVNHWHDIYHGKPGWIIVIHWEKIGMDGIKIMGFTLRSSAPWWAAKWKTPNWASFVVFFGIVYPRLGQIPMVLYIYKYTYTCIHVTYTPIFSFFGIDICWFSQSLTFGSCGEFSSPGSSIKKKTQLPSDVQHEVDEEAGSAEAFG